MPARDTHQQNLVEKLVGRVRLPDLTHQQFLVIEKLLAREMAGHQLRAALAKDGVVKSGPGFYQFMARMEDAGWLRGSYAKRVVDGHTVNERWYRLTGSGVKAYNATREFYESSAQRLGGLADA